MSTETTPPAGRITPTGESPCGVVTLEDARFEVLERKARDRSLGMLVRPLVLDDSDL
jgi:hypothetical protein